MSQKIQVALVYGGPSAEYEVSVNSARSIWDHLDQSKYDIVEVHITRDGVWKIDEDKLAQEEALIRLQAFDVALLAVHGSFGEDGKLQKLLENHRIIFTGSGSNASELGMDKIGAGEVFEKLGMPMPETTTASNPDQAEKEAKALGLPFVVKPVHQGSSVGVSIVHDDSQVKSAMSSAFTHDSHIIIQEFIAGREVSCGVLEGLDGSVTALPPTELIPIEGDFFDYHAKYTAGATNEITPPDMPPDIIKKIQDMAVLAHQSVGCSGYSRTDMFVRKGDVLVIEINTLPGMTKTSILPQQAAAAGMSFAELLDRIIACALKQV